MLSLTRKLKVSALLLSTFKWTGYGYIFINIQMEADGLRIITNMQMEMEVLYRHQHSNGGGWGPPLLLTFKWRGGRAIVINIQMACGRFRLEKSFHMVP